MPRHLRAAPPIPRTRRVSLTAAARKEAVIYARVSSKEQEREGYSIPAQLDLLRAYAAANGFSVVREFKDAETAKTTGRPAFGEMLALLESRRTGRAVLVEKTDRLYRNPKDWVTVEALGLEIHFVKENVVISPQSKSAEKFMHGIRVLMAKNFVDNLSEEVKKGMTKKAATGMWPSAAPLGYRNEIEPAGQRVIIPDPKTAPVVAALFKKYATQRMSLAEAASMDASCRERSIRFSLLGPTSGNSSGRGSATREPTPLSSRRNYGFA